MDIASVYLNMASLLGTEIEVEGYYAATLEATFLYGIEHERASTRIILPRYLATKNLINSFKAPMQAKLFLKGTLTQIRRGDLFLHHITSVSYKTDTVVFNLTITYHDHGIVCHQRTDFVFSWIAYFQGEYLPIRDITLASSILSKPVLLEGYLIPHVYTPPQHDVRLMMAVENIVYSLVDLWQPRPRKPPSPSDVFQLIFGMRLPWDKTRTEQARSKAVDVGGYNKIWIPKDLQASDFLDVYFGDRKRGESGFRASEDPYFTFAGTIDLIGESERKDKSFGLKSRLKFITIDYISARRIVTLSQSQEEWASRHLLQPI
jgi:hypothetical protein